MPIDVNLLRVERGGDPEKVRESQRRRFADVGVVDKVLELDLKWRSLKKSSDDCKKEAGILQKQIAPKMKKGENADAEKKRSKELKEQSEQMKKDAAEAELMRDKLLKTIGNLVEDCVPVSQDEEKDNVIVSEWGPVMNGNKPVRPGPSEEFMSHHDVLWRIGGYEPKKGVNVAGHRAYFLTQAGVMLNQSLLMYSQQFLIGKGYGLAQTPLFMNKEMMAGVAQLEQFDEELYKVIGEKGEEKYLIATSEQPMCGFRQGEWIDERELPCRYVGSSTCFRKEAGSHGRDTWGIFRVHQFDKVEQFVITSPEESVKEHERMLKCAEDFMQSLGIGYTVVNIVSGELNNAATKKFDLEAWFPHTQNLRELNSCSNCTDYQSRAMEIRCGLKKTSDKEKKYVHMLNATLCACTRVICAILELYQTKEDGVRIPEALVPFLAGYEKMENTQMSEYEAEMATLQISMDKAKEESDSYLLKTLTLRHNHLSDKFAARVFSRVGGKLHFRYVNEVMRNINKEKTEKGQAAAASAPKKEKAPPVSAPAPAASAGAEGVVANIVAKGNEIRDVKAKDKKDPKIMELVKELTALKEEYKTITGQAYIAPNTQGSKKDKKKGKAAPAPAPTPVPAPAASAGAGGADDVVSKIVAKGNEIRDVKAKDKKDPKIMELVKELTALKEEFKSVTGQAYIAPNTQGSKKDKKKAKNEGASSPALMPAPAPAAEQKKTVVATQAAIATAPTSVPALEKSLVNYSYIQGYVPSCLDAAAFNKFHKEILTQTGKYPNAGRWVRHVATFPPTVRASWKAHGVKVESTKPYATVAFLCRQHGDKAVSKDLLASIGEVVSPASVPTPAPKKDDDMDDMFGDDDDEDDAETLKAAKAKKIADAKAKKTGAKKVDRTQCVFEIKPWDAEQNLDDLAAKIKKTAFEGLSWGEAHKLVPVAFGIKKLIVSCIVVDDKVALDDVTDLIEAFEDEVQSVDLATMNRL